MRTEPRRTNGASKEVITIDSDDEEPQHESGAQPAEDEYEDIDDDEDPDCSYPPIIQDLDLLLDSPALHIAIPSITPAGAAQLPEYAQTHIIVAHACANSKIVLTAVPIHPPTAAEKLSRRVDIAEKWLPEIGTIARSLAIRILPIEEHDHDCRVLVATGCASLTMWKVTLNARQRISSPVLQQPRPATKVAFPFSNNQHQLLVCERSGAVRLLDPTQSLIESERPESRDSASEISSGRRDNGRWAMSYCTPFSTSANPSLARRKNILDTAWVLSGRAVMVLLEDGEWGLWDMQGTQAGKNAQDFAHRGYLGSSASADSVEGGKQKKDSTRLAPMTPNTRKTKSENLFSGPEKVIGVAPSGGISVSPTNNRSGTVDESVIMWYNNEIYSIPSMQVFWQRSSGAANNVSGFGSLYTPGFAHITDIDLRNENITSISQFASRSTSSSFSGQINVPRDLLVSTESRFIILQHQDSAAKRGLFQQVAEQPAMQDQRMLDAGELDLGGMDRLLEGMNGGGRARKVGFAN